MHGMEAACSRLVSHGQKIQATGGKKSGKTAHKRGKRGGNGQRDEHFRKRGSKLNYK